MVDTKSCSFAKSFAACLGKWCVIREVKQKSYNLNQNKILRQVVIPN